MSMSKIFSIKAGVMVTAVVAATVLMVGGCEDNPTGGGDDKSVPGGPFNKNLQFNPNINYGSLADPRDGKKYRTVKIGDLTWMAENLNFKMDSSWCYENNLAACERYGRLYDWGAAMGACPAGWRLPTRGDWDNLVQTVDDEGVDDWDVSKKLKSRTSWIVRGGAVNDDGTTSHCCNGTDDYGFSALAGGGGERDAYVFAGMDGSWWSATESTEKEGRTVHYYYIMVGNNEMRDGAYFKSCKISVRCVKND